MVPGGTQEHGRLVVRQAAAGDRPARLRRGRGGSSRRLRRCGGAYISTSTPRPSSHSGVVRVHVTMSGLRSAQGWVHVETWLATGLTRQGWRTSVLYRNAPEPPPRSAAAGGVRAMGRRCGGCSTSGAPPRRRPPPPRWPSTAPRPPSSSTQRSLSTERWRIPLGLRSGHGRLLPRQAVRQPASEAGASHTILYSDMQRCWEQYCTCLASTLF